MTANVEAKGSAWIARRDDSGGEAGLWSVIDADGEIVFFGLSEFRARLIAAAPDLLVVARELIGAIADKSIQRNPAYSSDDIKWLDKRARAAVAKAVTEDKA